MKTTTTKLTKNNALFPEKKLIDLTPSEFLKEYRHGRPDMTYIDKKPVVINRSAVLNDNQVRYIRTKYKEVGKTALAEMFELSGGYIYKVASKRVLKKVPDAGAALAA